MAVAAVGLWSEGAARGLDLGRSKCSHSFVHVGPAVSSGAGLRAVRQLNPPTREQLARYAARQRVPLSDDQLDDYVDHVSAWLSIFDRLDRLEEPRVALRHCDRNPGRIPSAAEDPFSAIVRFCEVKGAGSGRLGGMRIGVKDNIAVAGLPMANGERHDSAAPVPTEDAVVVERLLDAGATITAKTSIGGVDTSLRPTRNPHGPQFSAGGSSSGSAAAVAAGMVGAALGADQGGSVRIPSAWCGIVGMKATHGLIPSYGLIYWDHTLDHIGPMTNTVADNAAMLEVMAGGDWRDPQWVRADPVAGDYTGAAELGVEGLRIGVVTDSLEPSGCTLKTLRLFERARTTLSKLGAEVVPLSVPLWTDAPTILLAILTFGLTAMADSFGQGYGHLGRIDTNLLVATANQHLNGARDLPLGSRVLPLVFEHLREAYCGVHFGRAQNLRLELRRQLDAVFNDVDVLITPTTPTGPFELSCGDKPSVATLLANTCALNLSGHPALNVPSGLGDNNLPTGLQIIGRKFHEHTVYRVGSAFEAAGPFT